MKKTLLLFTFILPLFTIHSFAQWETPVAGENFSSKRVLNASPLRQPFAMVMGPDDSLWITERRGYVMRVNTSDGGKTQLLDINNLVNFTVSVAYTSAAGATSNSYTSAAGATSSGTVITVGSTTNLVVGMRVSVTAGAGAFAANCTVTVITSATKFTVSAAPTTSLSGGATVVRGYGNIITVGNTSNLQVGMTVIVTSGTGSFPANTTVTSITSSTRFVVSAIPSTPLSGGASVVKVTQVTGIAQDGMFGIALHPELNKGTGKDSVYLAYCYDSLGFRRVRIVAYKYNRTAATLTGVTVLLSGIWGSNDHNGGRLVIGNFGTLLLPDYKLIYTVGDKGSNQFGNACDSIESQYTPTAAQMAAGDIHRYNGKILRINMNGSIPADNPVINGVRTHIYTYGHRNPQGLTFEKKVNSPLELLPGGKLYESEQGPATNDEINIIDGNKNNYGWPRVAGKKDNNWYRYFQWSSSGSCGSYGGECSSNQSGSPFTESTFSDPKLTDPIFDLYAGTPSGGTSCNWLAYPTIAPSSVIHYPFTNRIPGWSNCLLITTLKTSSVFRLKLNASGTAPALTPGATGSDSVIQYFKFPGALNRYRDIALGNDGITFYLLTDSVGTTSGPSAGAAGVTDAGRVLEFIYLGSTLAVANGPGSPVVNRLDFKIYPNPVAEILTVESRRNTAKPLYYQLYDAAGRRLLQGRSTKDKFEVNVKQLQRGIYILKIFNGNEITLATEKILVK
ncbi:MAG: PQQ-dependent sugar dehydrogenase [Ferruginibacter sp.]|nr:PQQ-dependent sugar dehydrogenase [Ferruginibacter sp.]